jgi:hypothetical protein
LLIAVTSRLTLVVLTLQIAAIDHHLGVSDVVGIEGSSAHTMHCHGNVSGCVDAAGDAAIAIESVFALPREALRPFALQSSLANPEAAVTQAEPEPPRL